MGSSLIGQERPGTAHFGAAFLSVILPAALGVWIGLPNRGEASGLVVPAVLAGIAVLIGWSNAASP